MAGKWTSCSRFRCNSLIGSGTQSEVFSGIELATRRPVAIKIMRRKGVLGSLPTEAIALASIPPHDNIIPAPVCTMLQRSTSVCLVSPLYLSDLWAVAQRDLLPEPCVRVVMQSLFSALAHIHSHGWSHNDVKLENIFVRGEACGVLDVVIGDFGLATRGVSGKGQRGTKEYMSPELVELPVDGEYASGAADVWAAGVTGIRSLTGGSVAWLAGKPILPSLDSMSDACRNFFTTLFVVDPAARPSAKEMLDHPWLAPCPILTEAAPAAATSELMREHLAKDG